MRAWNYKSCPSTFRVLFMPLVLILLLNNCTLISLQYSDTLILFFVTQCSLGPSQRREFTGLRQVLAFLVFQTKLPSNVNHTHPYYPSFGNRSWSNSLSPCMGKTLNIIQLCNMKKCSPIIDICLCKIKNCIWQCLYHGNGAISSTCSSCSSLSQRSETYSLQLYSLLAVTICHSPSAHLQFLLHIMARISFTMVCEFREPTLWLRTPRRLPITLGEILNTPCEALYELTPVSLSTLSSYHSLSPPNTVLAIPRPCSACCHLRFPLLRTSSQAYSYAYPQPLLKRLIFRKTSPHYLIKNSLYHSLPACEPYFSSNPLHYVLIAFVYLSS